ncbi:MAG: hypothetical protein EBV15_05245 [Bacteroidetes bacterium]|nr:hypothetical protein [Bacteroidota bacterium]
MGLRVFWSALLLISFLIAGCNKENEPIPSYIRIDSVSVKTTPSQGNNIHEISAVNVYVDEQFMGLFEIPCTIPVLFSGKHKLSIIPSVRLNGALNQHVIHRLFNRSDTTIDLSAGKITHAGNIILTYKNNTEFAWLEDFEDNNSSLIRLFSAAGDTSFITTEPFSLKGRYAGNTRCMKVVIGAADTAKTVDMASFKYFGNLPFMGTDIMLEFDIKTPVPVQMAMIRKNSSGKLYLPYVYIFETDGSWKRFYINLIYELYNQPGDTEVQLMISPIKPAEIKTSQEIFIDNIRFSYPK